MFKIFIQRPVLATVISILLVILGLLGLSKLPYNNSRILHRHRFWLLQYIQELTPRLSCVR